ncbi:hypothetical protein HBI65_240150 [Parastagonospora nodorum]|nr:hypothetical protein HBI65_240150 [Parastagonospora nodorum]
MATILPTQEAALKVIAARVKRQSMESSDLSTDDITDYLRKIYDPKMVSSPRYFYSQDEYGMPIAKIPNANNSGVFCTVADSNTFEARDWMKANKLPKDFRGRIWPPKRLAHLTGSPRLSDVCVGCGQKDKPCPNGSCSPQSSSDRDREFWLQNILLRQVEDRGVGAFAREAVQSSLDIGELAGKVLTKGQGAQDSIYNTEISIGISPGVNHAWVDLTHTGSVTRYLNHSCEPNCDFYEGRCGEHYRLVWVSTNRAIAKGEELTVNYGPEWFKGPKDRCLCGKQNCENPPLETAPVTPRHAAARPTAARRTSNIKTEEGPLRTCEDCEQKKGKHSGLSDNQPICKACIQREKDANTVYTCVVCEFVKTGRYQGGKARPKCRNCWDRTKDNDKEEEGDAGTAGPARQTAKTKRLHTEDDDYEEPPSRMRKKPRKN